MCNEEGGSSNFTGATRQPSSPTSPAPLPTPQKRTVPDVPARPHKYTVAPSLFISCERVRGAFLFTTSVLKKVLAANIKIT